VPEGSDAEENKGSESAGEPEAPPVPDVPAGVPASQHPTYAKYFRSVRFGAPMSAVKRDMRALGLDADLLDTPDKLLPLDGMSFVTGAWWRALACAHLPVHRGRRASTSTSASSSSSSARAGAC